MAVTGQRGSPAAWSSPAWSSRAMLAKALARAGRLRDHPVFAGVLHAVEKIQSLFTGRERQTERKARIASVYGPTATLAICYNESESVSSRLATRARPGQTGPRGHCQRWQKRWQTLANEKPRARARGMRGARRLGAAGKGQRRRFRVAVNGVVMFPENLRGIPQHARGDAVTEPIGPPGAAFLPEFMRRFHAA